MTFGIVTMQQCAVGISPISAPPYALMVVTGISFGLLTSLFNSLCVLLQIIILRRVKLEHALQFVLAWIFGYLIDMFVALYGAVYPGIAELNYFIRILISCIGIIVQALGIVMILGADMLLPPGDSFMRTISTHYGRELSATKIASDFMWVGFALIVLLVGLFLQHTDLVGILKVINLGTILSAYGIGKCIGIFRNLFPRLTISG